MMTALAWCMAGLVLLIAGAELIVREGVRLASLLGIPPVVIGLTIVAVGTSAPELAVGIDAALRGNGDLAIGNIAGTNIVNILLILGLSALMRPLALRVETLAIDLPAIVGASVLFLIMVWDGSLSRTEGTVLVAMSLMYTAAIVHIALRERRALQSLLPASFVEPAAVQKHAMTSGKSLAVLATGIVLVVLGADWLVKGSVELARSWHVSEAFIGLTIIAIGTSAPEFVTTVVSTIRNKRDIAIGNLIGSSVYNILVILGITCIVSRPSIPVASSLIAFDIPIMVAVALLCIPVFYSGREVSRTEGGLFVSAYGVYLVYLLAVRT